MDGEEPHGLECQTKERGLRLRATGRHGGLKTGCRGENGGFWRRLAGQCRAGRGGEGGCGDRRTLGGLRRSEHLVKGLLGCGAGGRQGGSQGSTWYWGAGADLREEHGRKGRWRWAGGRHRIGFQWHQTCPGLPDRQPCSPLLPRPQPPHPPQDDAECTPGLPYFSRWGPPSDPQWLGPPSGCDSHPTHSPTH